MLSVERSQCHRDGLCRAVCPMGLIVEDGDGFPHFRPGGEASCIACGHCTAICPTEALANHLLPPTGSPRLDLARSVSAAEVDQLLKSRRSVREFRGEPVPSELIGAALEAARWAPSAVNRQPVHWLVIGDPAEVKRLAGLVAEHLRGNPALGARYAAIVELWDQGLDPILRGAPHLVVAHAADDWAWSTVDCTIALTCFEMAAVSRGLGTCWAGFLTWAARESPLLKEALGLPAGHSVCGALMLGFPRYRYDRVPPRQAARISWR